MVLIAVVCAEDEEVRDIASHMSDASNQEYLGRTFVRGSLYGVDAVVVRSRVGKVACGATTAVLLTQFKPDAVLFIGVAGGLCKDVSIGDIVVSTSAVQHDVDARPFRQRCIVPETGNDPHIPSSKPELADVVSSELRNVLANLDNYDEYGLTTNSLTELGITSPQVRRGVVATGDQFISTNEGRSLIRDLVPDAMCAEMEGAALAQVCSAAGVPFIILRAISDNGGDVQVDFIQFMRRVASPYCAVICKVALPAVAKALE